MKLALIVIGCLAPLFVVAAAEPAHTIYLIRHGAYVPDPRANPSIGPGLTALGIAQARLIGARLRGLPVHFDSITSSTLTRAVETAAVIHESLRDVPLAKSPLVSECTPPTLRAAAEEPSPEQTACASKLNQAFAEFFVPAKNADRNDVVVAHGNVIRWLTMRVLGVDARAWLGMTVAHTSLTIIRVRADGSMSVLSVGDVGHIPPNLLSWGTDDDPQLAVPKESPRE